MKAKIKYYTMFEFPISIYFFLSSASFCKGLFTFSGRVLISAFHHHVFLSYGVNSELMHRNNGNNNNNLFIYFCLLVELYGINFFRLVNGYIKLKVSSV